MFIKRGSPGVPWSPYWDFKVSFWESWKGYKREGDIGWLADWQICKVWTDRQVIQNASRSIGVLTKHWDWLT